MGLFRGFAFDRRMSDDRRGVSQFSSIRNTKDEAKNPAFVCAINNAWHARSRRLDFSVTKFGRCLPIDPIISKMMPTFTNNKRDKFLIKDLLNEMKKNADNNPISSFDFIKQVILLSFVSCTYHNNQSHIKP